MAAASTVLAFLAGLVVGIQLLAALYGPRDVWYTIRAAWPTVLRRIVLWTGVSVAAMWLLGGAQRRAFLLGMGAHLLMHVATWLLVTHAFPRKLGPTPMVE